MGRAKITIIINFKTRKMGKKKSDNKKKVKETKKENPKVNPKEENPTRHKGGGIRG